MTKDDFINSFEIHEKIVNQAKEKAKRIISEYGCHKPFSSYRVESISFDIRNNMINFQCEYEGHITNDSISLDFLFVEFDMNEYVKLRLEAEKREKEIYQILKDKYEPRPFVGATGFGGTFGGSLSVSPNATITITNHNE